jgi:ammonia channel protein AmtB
MNDPRAIIAGILAAIALTGATLLAALNRDAVHVAALLGLAGTFGAYAMGLYSEPRA